MRNYLRQIDIFRKIGKAMKVERVSKIWVRMSTTNISLLQFRISSSENEDVDFECRYIRTHTKEKPCKISDITLAILPFYQRY